MIPPMNPRRQSVELVARTGRLRQRVENTGTLGDWTLASTTRYIYDGWRVIQERDGSNVPTVSYTRGTDLSGSLEGAGGIGGLLARSHGYSSGNWTTHNFYHADGNGNITYLVNSSQTVAASYRYDPFGNTLSSSGSLAGANVYRFSSKEIHVNSGLYYYGYRFYDPSVQRWLNRDPIGEEGGVNLYRFVENDPISLTDGFGMESGGASTWPPVIPPGMPYYPPSCPKMCPCKVTCAKTGTSSSTIQIGSVLIRRIRVTYTCTDCKGTSWEETWMQDIIRLPNGQRVSFPSRLPPGVYEYSTTIPCEN